MGSTAKSLKVTKRGSASVKSASVKAKTANENPVSKLRPKKPLIGNSDDSILSVCQMMCEKRSDAALIVGEDGGLAGIVSDTDIVRRVVAKHLDHSCSVDGVMTPNPKCVLMSDSAVDALGMMVENHFRHLPVLDDKGSVVGLLDIAKCLYEAISKLERLKEKEGGEGGANAGSDALASALAGVGGAQAAALSALLGPLLAAAAKGGGDGSVPTLRTVLANKKAVIVGPGTNIRDTAIEMAEARKAALVVEDDALVGIFTFKDVMNRAVAKEMPLELTAVSSLMTPSPDTVLPEMDVLEALQTMHDNKFLNLPVVDGDGSVLGLVDVMDLISAVGGADGWRSIFSSALDAGDDFSDTSSLRSMGSTAKSSRRQAPSQVHVKYMSSRLSNYDRLPESPGASEISHMARAAEAEFVFKLVDRHCNTHRIKSKTGDIAKLLGSVAEKLGGGVTPDEVRLKFTDDEGDVVLISDDEGLKEAVELQRSAGNNALKLNVETVKSGVKSEAKAVENGERGTDKTLVIGAAAVGGIALIAGIAMVFSRPKR